MENIILNISGEDHLYGSLKFKVLLFFSESEKFQLQALLLLILICCLFLNSGILFGTKMSG